ETSARSRVTCESISVVACSASSTSARAPGSPSGNASARGSGWCRRPSTWRRYPASVGTRPAEVCGCVRRPSRSSSASSLRTVEGETPSPERSTSDFDPTGWPVATYSSTTSRRMSRWRSESGICTVSMVGGPSGEQSRGDTAAEKASAGGQRQRSLAAQHEPQRGEPVDLGGVDGRLGLADGKRLVETKAEHQTLDRLRLGCELLVLAARRLAATERLEVGGKRRSVPPAGASDRAHRTDPDPEVVVPPPVAEVVACAQVAVAGAAEVRGLVPVVARGRQCRDDSLGVRLHRLGLRGELFAMTSREARAALGLELVRGDVLRLELERLAQVALEVGGGLPGDPIDEVE